MHFKFNSQLLLYKEQEMKALYEVKQTTRRLNIFELIGVRQSHLIGGYRRKHSTSDEGERRKLPNESITKIIKGR